MCQCILTKVIDIIVVVMLKFRQILVVSYLFNPANLENDIFSKVIEEEDVKKYFLSLESQG